MSYLPPAYGSCDCCCHTQPGVMHFMPCCGPSDEPPKRTTFAEPVAYRWHFHPIDGQQPKWLYQKALPELWSSPDVEWDCLFSESVVTRLEQALLDIIERSHNGELGTSKVIDMRKIAEAALKERGL